MIEVRYGDKYGVIDLAEPTVSEARERFCREFGIPGKAKARLNGRYIRTNAEPDTVLQDDDKLTFVIAKNRRTGIILVSAILLALAITGSVFAYGFTNSSTSLGATVFNSNFADVTVDPDISNISWSVFGSSKGTIDGPYSIFNVTPASGYTGDLMVSVTLANVDQLVKYYRTLALKVDIINSSDNSTVDINDSGDADNSDWVLLTLDNASVNMPVQGGENVSVRIESGYYIANTKPLTGWDGNTASPQLFCEVAQGAATSSAQNPKPLVTTNITNNVDTTSATLIGNLTSLGAAANAEVYFQWGTSSHSYPNQTTAQTMTATGTFSATLTGLTPGTTYYFRAVAVGQGTTYGLEHSFSTPAPPPSITVTAPSALDFGTFKIGANAVADDSTGTQGSVTVTLNSASNVNWQVTAQDTSTSGYMKSGSNQLGTPLNIGANNTDWSPASTGITYTGNYNGSVYAGSPFNFYANQAVGLSDPSGTYSITITFTATIIP